MTLVNTNYTGIRSQKIVANNMDGKSVYPCDKASAAVVLILFTLHRQKFGYRKYCGRQKKPDYWQWLEFPKTKSKENGSFFSLDFVLPAQYFSTQFYRSC